MVFLLAMSMTHIVTVPLVYIGNVEAVWKYRCKEKIHLLFWAQEMPYEQLYGDKESLKRTCTVTITFYLTTSYKRPQLFLQNTTNSNKCVKEDSLLSVVPSLPHFTANSLAEQKLDLLAKNLNKFVAFTEKFVKTLETSNFSAWYRQKICRGPKFIDFTTFSINGPDHVQYQKPSQWMTEQNAYFSQQIIFHCMVWLESRLARIIFSKIELGLKWLPVETW